MILVSEEEESHRRPGQRRLPKGRRAGSAGPRLCGAGGGGADSRGSSWDRSLHREDWKHGSIGKLDHKEGSENDLFGNPRRKRPRSHPTAGYHSKSVLSSVDSLPHYAAHTAASSARISRSVDRYQGEAFFFLHFSLLSVQRAIM